MFQVCLAHWNNKRLQLFWIHWTGMEEVFKYIVWPKPHDRWQAKLESKTKQKLFTLSKCLSSLDQKYHMLRGINNHNVVDLGVAVDAAQWSCSGKLLKVRHTGSKMCPCGLSEFHTSTMWFCFPLQKYTSTSYLCCANIVQYKQSLVIVLGATCALSQVFIEKSHLMGSHGIFNHLELIL